jgi:hypothetical protein
VTSETAPPTSAASDHHLTEREAHSSAADQRHTCASLPLAQNVPARVVMEILGHSQLARSTDLYSHVMPTALRAAADAMDRGPCSTELNRVAVNGVTWARPGAQWGWK